MSRKNKSLLLVIFTLLISSCGESNKNISISLEDIPTITPAEIAKFDHVDSLYYSYLGVNTFALQDAGFIMAVWDPVLLVHVDDDNGKIISATTKGRGPGEFLNIGRPTADDNFLYIYDQFQKKAVILNKDTFTPEFEMVLSPFEEFSASRVYPKFGDETLPVEYRPSSLAIDKMHQRLLLLLNTQNHEFEKSIKIEGRPYAPIGELINGHSGSAVQVPFENNQFIVPVNKRKTLLMYDTRTNIISEINSDFDTLNTIPVNLPTEEITESEMDSIKVKYEFSSRDWKSVEPWLPKFKAPADDMHYFKNSIWLKSNLRSENDIWFILNMEGEIKNLVHLPKNSWLTHISDYHLGVRLDDATFALYEPVN